MRFSYGLPCLFVLITANIVLADCKDMVGKRVGVSDIVSELEIDDFDLVYYIFSSVNKEPNLSCGDRAFALSDQGLGKMCEEGQRLSAEGELFFLEEEKEYYVVSDTVHCSDK